ncbi:hypothetical protein JHK82_041107 [Glycine max]|uniref:Uncharacterized protein n=2 Tax=Glycine subgen. Soja TaxID=1462606 RepID=K7M903_SOYBN|nr:uncharacterized protein LOC112999630 [Glycine max]XP_028202656.1 uncharacterized protein LOC114386802 [Glycine soja]KAG4955401.1 hypothetical protein JHK85_041781 [Glycine max]KAG5104137.1 hypothetical protein JHK82_041107 [Glycine max]KAG5115266.1 hypothetical protein JHK84_041379 [Glycine max]KAH1145008.1 hypothetical protein GYH30_041036 [Glycine max]KHM98749.1 hypothetical protein glysoja_030802 [Glycine soja]|eukprot:XP_025981748.1 uncharacterized protein LOC112999630 [Glycine max]
MLLILALPSSCTTLAPLSPCPPLLAPTATLLQGRGNKSSGDNFLAAPNIDHSQDFVRKDLKEWLCWMRNNFVERLSHIYGMISSQNFIGGDHCMTLKETDIE